ncbi:hypothetical protein RF11_06176 [Thelohanellus kitauei]|uniref:Uncharacterized protein n=1 Tax=Thelohanellus kitauei TaxID=669202 RepID=A0A0C2M9J0_THEKT|nr:hypothetical protein RF11_06176 [Thelohanellus kitauei]
MSDLSLDSLCNKAQILLQQLTARSTMRAATDITHSQFQPNEYLCNAVSHDKKLDERNKFLHKKLKAIESPIEELEKQLQAAEVYNPLTFNRTHPVHECGQGGLRTH